jgi:hypothetical protein
MRDGKRFLEIKFAIRSIGIYMNVMSSKNLVQISRKSLIFKVQKHPLDNSSLGITDVKYCTITCLSELDIAAGMVESKRLRYIEL